MQSYCVFCIYTTFYTIKAYIITIKNKLMNKISYRYTTKLLSRTIGGSVGMAGCHTTYGHKKRSPKSFDSEDLNKEGSHLLSRIALQYHRRKRA